MPAQSKMTSGPSPSVSATRRSTTSSSRGLTTAAAPRSRARLSAGRGGLGDEQPGRAGGARGLHAEQPDGPRADDRDGVAEFDSGAAHSVDGDGAGLGQRGDGVGHGVGDGL